MQLDLGINMKMSMDISKLRSKHNNLKLKFNFSFMSIFKSTARIFSLSIPIFVLANIAMAESENCPEGRRFDEASGQCILNIPSCGPREYLDQLSLTCVPKPLSAADCARQGLRFDSSQRRCIPRSFQDYCEDAEQPYEFVRTVSCILNRIEAYHCQDAEEYLRNQKKLVLNDPRFRIGSLKPLEYLDFLEELSLENQALNDIDSLSHLTKLKRLSLANNAISDLSPLLGLTELTYLDISGNPVNDFTALKELPKLKTLVIDASRIKTLSNQGLKLELKESVPARSN